MEAKKPILSILIPTVIGREVFYGKLYDKLWQQIINNNLTEEVEIVCECDDRVMSIGSKRQLLVTKAKGKFVVFIDDDDDIPYEYCQLICDAIKNNEDIDAIGFLQQCTFNGGVPVLASLSNRWNDWGENMEQFRYVRTPFFPTPMLREYAFQVGYNDMRYGEDHDFSRRLKQSGLIKNEFFIDKIMYYYIYVYAPSIEKYGVNI